MSEQRPMKDGLGKSAAERIASSFACVMDEFPKRKFVAAATKGLDDLELKERVQHFIAVLHQFLPAGFNETADVLMQLKEHWDRGDSEDNLSGFAAWPVIDYVGEHGLEHPEKALAVLKYLTSMFSAEFAIRPFIIQHPKTTMQTIGSWCNDPDWHVRRLVSEGCRPRLPWGCRLPQFIDDPSPVLQLLEQLKDDPEEYVRRSVANNLNDISKDHPEIAIDLCKRWQNDADENRQWIIRHATRTLVKDGHPKIFGLLGYTENPSVKAGKLTVAPKEIRLGQSVELSATIQSTVSAKQSFVVDYVVHHMKANGKTSPKVFKLREVKLPGNGSVKIKKQHLFKPITTRKYYSGEHSVELLINGLSIGRADFILQL